MPQPTAHARQPNQLPRGRRHDMGRMLYPLVGILVKIAPASPVAGTILTHFGITAERPSR